MIILKINAIQYLESDEYTIKYDKAVRRTLNIPDLCNTIRPDIYEWGIFVGETFEAALSAVRKSIQDRLAISDVQIDPKHFLFMVVELEIQPPGRAYLNDGVFNSTQYSVREG